MGSVQKSPSNTSSWSVVGNTAWAGTSNITDSDNSFATVDLDMTNNSSQALRGIDFGFSIPGFYKLTGFVASFEKYADVSDSIRDTHVYLVKNGALIGNNKSVGDYWSSTEGTINFGSPTDKWGTSLTYAFELDSTFGVMIACGYYNAYGADVSAYVDHVQLTVYYETNFGACGWTGGGGTGDIVTQIQKIYYGTVLVDTIKHGSTTVYTDV